MSNYMTAPATDETSEQRSERLWPDPFSAPDVPPRSWLLQYVTGTKSAMTDREAQLAESANAQRALAVLHAELAFGAPPEESSVSQSASEHGTEAIVPFSVMLGPSSGQLWTTKGRVRHFDGHRLALRETFLPVTVLLLEMAFERCGKRCWKVVPVSPEETWPDESLSLDECRIQLTNGEEWVAHLWLEDEMPVDELHALCGSLSEPHLATLGTARIDLQAGRPISMACEGGYRIDEKNHELLLERARLAEQASWIGRTLTALAAWEVAVSAPAWTSGSELRDAIAAGIAARWRMQAAAASPEASIFPCFGGEGSKEQLLEALSRSREEGAVEQFFAVRDARRLPPTPDCPFAVEWELRHLGGEVRDGETFYVYHIASAEIAGVGFVVKRSGQVFAVLQSGGAEALNPDPAQIVLLFPRP